MRGNVIATDTAIGERSVKRAMLNTQEIVRLGQSKNYERIVKSHLKGAVTDLLKSRKLSPSLRVGGVLRWLDNFLIKRFIHQELQTLTRELFERMINRDLRWNPTPKAVKRLIDGHKPSFQWIEFTTSKINLLFSNTINMMEDVKLRSILLEHSSLASQETKNIRLNEIIAQLERLSEQTIDYIEKTEISTKIMERDRRKDFELNWEDHSYRVERDSYRIEQDLGGGVLGAPGISYPRKLSKLTDEKTNE